MHTVDGARSQVTRSFAEYQLGASAYPPSYFLPNALMLYTQGGVPVVREHGAPAFSASHLRSRPTRI